MSQFEMYPSSDKFDILMYFLFSAWCLLGPVMDGKYQLSKVSEILKMGCILFR